MPDQAVDTSMYGTLQPQGSNLLGMMGQYANMQNSLNQNRLFQQEFAAKQAMGPIFQQAVRPDGTMDWGKALTGLAVNPQTAFKAPEVAQQIAQKQLLDQQTLNASVEGAKSRLNVIGSAAGSLIPFGENVTQDQVRSAMMNVYNQGGFGQPGTEGAKAFYIRAISDMPPDGPQLHNWVLQHTIQAEDASKSLDQMLGTFQSVNQGTQTWMGYVSPFTGARPSGSLPMGMTPGDTNALVPVTVSKANASLYPGVPIGTTINVPRAQAAPIVGGLNQQPPVNPMGPPPTDTQQGPGAQGNPPGTAGATTPPPYSVKTLSPTETAQITQGNEYKGELDKSYSGLVAAQQQIYPIRDALNLTQTGGGMALREKAAQIMQFLPGISQHVIDQAAGGNLAAAQVIQNAATTKLFQNLRQLINGAGRFAVLEFNVLQQNSPNLDTDPRAWKTLIGLTDYITNVKKAEVDAYPKYLSAHNGDPSGFENWWDNKLVDSGVFKTGYTKFGGKAKDVGDATTKFLQGQ